MKNVYKEYEKPFLLEPTKLGRLVDKVHERLGDHANTTVHDSFEVFLSGDRREEMTDVEDVLAIDNSRKHQIKRLVIACSASTAGAARPEHEVQVDFGGQRPSSSPGLSTKIVSISVRSDAAGWASRTLSEVEEQVERSWLPQATPSVAVLLGIALALLVLFAVIPPTSLRVAPDSRVMWLSDSNLDTVATMLARGQTLGEEQLRKVVTMQLRNVVDVERPQHSSSSMQTRRAWFLVVPLLVVIGCIITLLARCYPGTVFLWGDGVNRYQGTVQLRKVLWGVIIGIVVIGALANSLFAGLSTWVPR